MKITTLGLFSAAALLGTAAFADHSHGAGHHAPTADECEALEQARDEAMETDEPMSDEDRRRLEMCEHGTTSEMNGDGEEDEDADSDHEDGHDGH